MSTQILPSHCGCGCRPARAVAQGCPCRECQPGPGIDFMPQRAVRLRHTRIQALLAKPELTAEEDKELEVLASQSIYWSLPRRRT